MKPRLVNEIFETRGASFPEHRPGDEAPLMFNVSFLSRTRIGNREYLIAGLKEPMEAAKPLIGTLSSMARLFKVKGILLASPEALWMREKIAALTDTFLMEHSISENGVLAAAVQGASCSRFRAVEAVRAALRKLSWMGIPRYGAIVEACCSSSIQELEIRRMVKVMEEFLGPEKKLTLSFKLGGEANSLTATLINIGLSLNGVEESLDLNLFQLEPEAGREQKLFLDLPIPTIPE